MSSEVVGLPAGAFAAKSRGKTTRWPSDDSAPDGCCVEPHAEEESAVSSAAISEEDQLEAIRSGDAEAFSSLFHRCSHIVRSVAVRILKDSAEAEDLVQDVFLYIYRNCTSFDRNRGTARTWIIQIAYHRAIDRRRYLQNRRFYNKETIDEAATTVPDPEPKTTAYDRSLEAVLGREEAQRLFESLSKNQRETFRLLFFEGYTFDEIASLRGESLGNVRNHYYRGLERLRRQLFATNLRRR
jgi:RNA polymerase sigma-70 factor (ECF subfamily)